MIERVLQLNVVPIGEEVRTAANVQIENDVDIGKDAEIARRHVSQSDVAGKDERISIATLTVRSNDAVRVKQPIAVVNGIKGFFQYNARR